MLSACAGGAPGPSSRPSFNPYWLRSDKGLHPLSLFSEYRDDRLTSYVQSVASRLASVDPMVSEDDYEIEIVDAGTVNAQVYQGRKLSVTLGLLGLLQDEAELASVIAHELAHIALKGAPRPERISATGQSREAAREKAGQILAALSRQTELAADRRGQWMMAEAGYDTGAMATAMRRIGADREKGQRRFSVTAAQSSHPFGAERLAALNPSNGGERRADAYLDAINGMPFRPPDEFARPVDGGFVSVDHRLALTIPEGYIGASGSSSMTLRKPGSDVSLLLLARPRSPLPLDKALTDGLYPIMARDYRLGALGGVSAYQGFGGRQAVYGALRSRRKSGVAVDMALTAIDDGPRRFFGLAVAPAEDPSLALREWRAFEQGIRPLSESEAAPYTSRRLVVVRVREGQTVSDFAKRFGVGEDGEAMFRRINGLGDSERLAPGRRVRTVP